MEGYDHILDTQDEGKDILRIAEEENNNVATVEFLKSIQNYTASTFHNQNITYLLLLFSNGNPWRFIQPPKFIYQLDFFPKTVKFH